MTDLWATWLLKTRFGGDKDAERRGMDWLETVRDRVLEGAVIKEGHTVLDVGCGDGLIGRGALERVGPRGRVIFSDISEDLLDAARAQIRALDQDGKSQFLVASADDLQGVSGESVDAVTTRSVLIYVENKRQVLREFHRVLKSEGRISLAEPINRFSHDRRRGDQFRGSLLPGLENVIRRLNDFFVDNRPECVPMLDFDERDLIDLSEEVGFRRIHLDLDINVGPAAPTSWKRFLEFAPNPLVPPLGNVLKELLSPHELEQFEDAMRPQVEAGGGIQRRVMAYLWAVK